jgi:hypothetical protein
LTIVPKPWPASASALNAFTELVAPTKKVSSASWTVSLITRTMNVFVVSPGANATVPLAGS